MSNEQAGQVLKAKPGSVAAMPSNGQSRGWWKRLVAKHFSCTVALKTTKALFVASANSQCVHCMCKTSFLVNIIRHGDLVLLLGAKDTLTRNDNMVQQGEISR